MPLIVDAHLDLAWNALAFDRDQRRELSELRAREAAMDLSQRGTCSVSLPELRRAGVGVAMVTLLGRTKADLQRQAEPLRCDIDYADASIAHSVCMGQLAYYDLLERQGLMRRITDAAGLREVWEAWEQGRPDAPLGTVLCIEGADPIIRPDHAAWWYEKGVRVVGLAHYGQGRYAMGTGGDGPLTREGRALVDAMGELGMIIDLTHTGDQAVGEIIDRYPGRVCATHCNARALVDNDRQLTDEQIKAIAARHGVVGMVMHIAMLKAGKTSRMPERADVTLQTVADHVDHICQLLGDAGHVGLGSDLDGGFGVEACPADLDSIADLQKLAIILEDRGYTAPAIASIMHGNWLRFLRDALGGVATDTDVCQDHGHGH